MKKNLFLILSVFLSIFLMSFTSVLSSPYTSKIFLWPSKYVNYAPGDIFTVDIWVHNVTNLYGFEFKLDYDTNTLDVVEISNLGLFLTGGVECNDVDYCYRWKQRDYALDGYVYIAASLLNDPDYPIPPVSGMGKLARIKFKVMNRGSYKLTLYDTKLSDINVNPIIHTPNHCPFDMENDGWISITDVSSAAQAFGSYPGHPRWNPAADTDINGFCNIADVAIVARLFGQPCWWMR